MHHPQLPALLLRPHVGNNSGRLPAPLSTKKDGLRRQHRAVHQRGDRVETTHVAKSRTAADKIGKSRGTTRTGQSQEIQKAREKRDGQWACPRKRAY
ncbi:unnamed protein product [Ectocarpus sp. CCAP 1310/34]|nr:unnamed protein product [Ectocarpus sp. CCAP 1310/34]